MYSFFRYAALLTLLAVTLVGCTTVPELDKYVLIVFSEDGTPLEGALVTPQINGKNFESKTTGVDGLVDLRGIYSEVPTTIEIRAGRHKAKTIPWSLPSPTVQAVILDKL